MTELENQYSVDEGLPVVWNDLPVKIIYIRSVRMNKKNTEWTALWPNLQKQN